MKIAIIGNMAFAKEMLEAKVVLEKRGHKAFVSDFVKDFSFYKAEIEGVKPIVLGGDLSEITSRIK